MKAKRTISIVWVCLGIGGVAAGLGVAWLLSLPIKAAGSPQPPVPRQEAEADLDSLKPPRPRRPVIAILGINDATELTDYVMPYGILTRADVADVLLLATQPGNVRLFPALTVAPQATVSEFDARHPEGADYVIVPAMSRDDDPDARAWLRDQWQKGARIIGVCAGAKVVADAGLLEGRRATTHWYYVSQLRREHPAIRYIADRRFVVDDHVATTTGITASMPMALTLVEAIAGQEKAAAVGRDIGVEDWDARHDSDAFQFNRRFVLTAIRNSFAFWNRETLGLELKPDVDEVSLALVADAWSRTYRSRAVTFTRGHERVSTRNGLLIVPDRVASKWPEGEQVPTEVSAKPAHALERALRDIEDRYDRRTADFVAMQLEYPQAD